MSVHLAQTDTAQTTGAMVGDDPKPIPPNTEEEYDGVGCVKWIGPGHLVLPPGACCQAKCKVVHAASRQRNSNA